jgi:hypothetical protein
MKLARATLFVVYTNDLTRAGRSYRQPGRPVAVRKSTVRRPPNRLVARWQVSPLTQRLECVWSLEHAISDSQLCRRPRQKLLSNHKRHRPSHIRAQSA